MENGSVPEVNDETTSGTIELASGVEPDRKIIYKAELNIYTSTFTPTIEYIYSLIESDEWFDSESITENSAIFIVRIKTERLDAVIQLLKNEYDVRNTKKTGTDISLNYQDMSDKIAALTIQRDRLLELYEEASLSDMIQINEQLSNIEVEIAQHQGNLNLFDSLVDYSELKIYLQGSELKDQKAFFPRVGLAFQNGLGAIVIILDGLAIAIVTILPISVVFVPAGYGIYRIRRHFKKIKKAKNETQ
jgi:hypothetical protein